MKFLCDMGISGNTAAWLKSHNHDAKHLRDESLQRLPDNEIFLKAKQENRIILTFDLDFGDIAAAAGTSLPSIIIFRLQDQRPANVNRRLNIVLRDASDDLNQGAIILVEEARYRIRHLPIK